MLPGKGIVGVIRQDMQGYQARHAG